jgi:hypothetical protein
MEQLSRVVFPKLGGRAVKEYAEARELEFCEKLYWQTLFGKTAIQVFNQNIKWTEGARAGRRTK